MLLALVVALSMGAPAASTAPVAPPAATAAKQRNPDTETVCIVEAPVGSHLQHKYCAPRSYWELRTRRDRESLSSFYQSGGGGGGAGGFSATPGGGSGR